MDGDRKKKKERRRKRVHADGECTVGLRASERVARHTQYSTVHTTLAKPDPSTEAPHLALGSIGHTDIGSRLALCSDPQSHRCHTHQQSQHAWTDRQTDTPVSHVELHWLCESVHFGWNAGMQVQDIYAHCSCPINAEPTACGTGILSDCISAFQL